MASTHDQFMKRMHLTALPPASGLMGTEVIDFDEKAGRITIRYTPDPGFRNLVGTVHGGFLCAMLDECMGFAGIVSSGFARLCPTVEVKTSFLRPAPMGVIIGEGHAIRMGRTIAFLEGRLTTEEGVLVSTGSATGSPMTMPDDWSTLFDR